MFWTTSTCIFGAEVFPSLLVAVGLTMLVRSEGAGLSSWVVFLSTNMLLPEAVAVLISVALNV